METFTLDIPLLLTGLAALLWLRFRRSNEIFQVACQFVGTFWAQYSFGVSWSLGKLVPFLAASRSGKKRIKHASIFIPFVAYAVLGGSLAVLAWDIPERVDFAYGQGRFLLQTVILLTLAFTARAFAQAMTMPSGPQTMWKALVLMGLVHGVAFSYQYLASAFGLPYIGISRAHGQTLIEGTADFAAFRIAGMDILRPGGLAGEPKTVAVIFGIVLLPCLLAGRPVGLSRRWEIASSASVAMAAVGFVGAFSTSAFIGAALAYLLLIGIGMVRAKRTFIVVGVFVATMVSIEGVLRWLELPGITELLRERTLDRLQGGERLDPPVAAALQLLSHDVRILFFGTGNGGGTFFVKEQLGVSDFEYAMTPNVGMVAMLLEFGVLGSLLLLLPAGYLFFLATARMRRHSTEDGKWEVKFLLALSVTCFVLMLSGSGIALGYPLAIGGLLGAAQYVRGNDVESGIALSSRGIQ